MPLILDRSSDDIPIWNLHQTFENIPAHLRSYNYVHEGKGDYDDNRTPVTKKDILPGGKYRSIVKLFLHYESQSRDDWTVATGFLIRDDLVATAGHCAYDRSYELGRLDEVKVYLGYSGRVNVDNPEVEFRSGQSIATTNEWNEAERVEADLAFIKLDEPFYHIEPIEYKNTPDLARKVIGVVGYPGDIRQDGEPGGRLQQDFQETRWNIHQSGTQTLEYTIDPNGGNSGSPVFDEEDMCCIAVHTRGGSKNTATVIGPEGYNFDDYIEALDQHVGTTRRQSLRARMQNVDDVAEILKLAKEFDSPISRDILSPDSSLTFGQLGIPSGAIAHMALSSASNAVLENVRTDKQNFVNDHAFNGVAERATVAEAALVAVQEMSRELRQEENVFANMTDVVKKLLPTVQQAGPAVINASLEPLLRVALDEARKSAQGGRNTRPEPIPSLRQLGVGSRTKRSQTSNRKKNSFIEAVSESSSDRAQRFFSALASEAVSDDAEIQWHKLEIPRELPATIGPLVEAGQGGQIGGGWYNKQQQQQYQYQQQHQYSRGQRLSVQSLFDSEEQRLTAEFLPLRAAVSEAALQAILKIPEEALEQEGLLEVMREVMEGYGPMILKVAPGIIRRVSPVFVAIADEAEVGRQAGFQQLRQRGARGATKGVTKGMARSIAKSMTKSLAKTQPQVSTAELDFLEAF
ncbi:trypsin-like cysteine/serine peptidase domain-containing protein [Aspergillus carlsbadensis]|nr:trypsin-like cysteine/serine peptidase domain-containing protein [Aspergillus carlsbadensis]